MAASGSDESDFGDLIERSIQDRDQGFASDDQSDISVSSVNTSDLSDFHESDFQDLTSASSDLPENLPEFLPENLAVWISLVTLTVD